MAQRFAVEGLNEIQSLTGGGADMASLSLKAFEPMKQEMSAAKPAPSIAPGGMA